jgi:uncharacterized membrane protein
MREIVLTPRRALIAGILGGLGALALRRPASGQSAAPAVLLFRVVSPRDAVTIGVTAEELASWGSGEGVSVLAARLAAAGHLTVWAYAVGRAEDGTLAMLPRGRVVLVRDDPAEAPPDGGFSPGAGYLVIHGGAARLWYGPSLAGPLEGLSWAAPGVTLRRIVAEEGRAVLPLRKGRLVLAEAAGHITVTRE